VNSELKPTEILRLDVGRPNTHITTGRFLDVSEERPQDLTIMPMSKSIECSVSSNSPFDRKSSEVGTVIIVTPGGIDNGGGIGRQMGYFIEANQHDGTAYRIVDSRGPWFLGASPFHMGFAGCYLLTAMLKLIVARFSTKPLLVHVNITGRGSTIRKVIILIITGLLLKIKYVLHVHDYDYATEYTRHGEMMKRFISLIFHRAAKILVLGIRERDALTRLLQLDNSQIAVLHNAVPDPISDVAETRDVGGPIHILFLGHLSARKGVPELLQALAGPVLRSKQWRATLAGGGPVDEFRSTIDEFAVAERVNFTGWLDEPRVRALCADADILVLPSHAEGLAMAVLEGLSYGLAVVTTPVGAHPEVIEPGISGLFVPPGDVDALAAALQRLIDDKDLRRRLGMAARLRFLEKFDVRAYAERLAQLHRNVLSKQQSRSENIQS